MKKLAVSFIMFVVSLFIIPPVLALENVDEKVSVFLGRSVKDHQTKTRTIPIIVKNISDETLQTPIKIIITNITNSHITLATPDGTTNDNKPYIILTAADLTDGKLLPNQTAAPKNAVFNNGALYWFNPIFFYKFQYYKQYWDFMVRYFHRRYFSRYWFSFTASIFAEVATPQDSTPPFTDQKGPAAGAVDVLPDTNIRVHILDGDSGVDLNSVILKVEGATVFDGSNSDNFPRVSISGDPKDFTLNYDPEFDFDLNEGIAITIHAEDIAGNVMPTDNYSFTVRQATADEAVENGKSKLINDFDVIGALGLFKEALDSDPDHQKAKFWHSLIVLFSNQDLLQLLKEVGLVDENNQAIFDQAVNLPNGKSTTEVQNIYLSTLTEINSALTLLSCIELAFTDQITPKLGGMDETFDFDFAEVKLTEAFFHLLKTFFNAKGTYDFADMDIDTLLSTQGLDLKQLLIDNPTLFTLLPDASTRLGNTKTAIQDWINAYIAASDFIRNERTDEDGLNHIVRFYDPFISELYDAPQEWEDEKMAALEQEEKLRNTLSKILNHLGSPDNFPVINLPLNMIKDGPEIDDDGNLLDVNLNEFLTNPKDVNAMLSELLTRDFMLEGFVDPTLEGTFPKLTLADWNHFLGNGPVLFRPFASFDTGIVSVRLFWSPLKDKHKPNFVRHEVYRSETEDVNTSSNLVAVVTNPDSIQFIDTSIAPVDAFYYYRIYTYYNFGSGEAAISYTNKKKVEIIFP